jgi:HrpA-like RNA helicase
MLPTLKIKGKLVYVEGTKDDQAELDKYTPVDYVIHRIKTMMQNTGVHNRLLILKSETASGKSTVFPAELYNALVHGKPPGSPGIVCTQPRVLTAIENVRSILQFYGKTLRLGENIGWSTKYNKLRTTRRGLMSVTIGTLNQQLRTMSDEDVMNAYRYILIDETHERDIQTDMTISMVKNLLYRNSNNPACPLLVLMSATFEPQTFLKYFGCTNENFVWCRGETAGFDQMWDWNEGKTVNDVCRTSATVVEKIISANPDDDPEKADILIFLPGRREFDKAEEYLTILNSSLGPKGLAFSLLRLDSEVVKKQGNDYNWIMNVPVDEQIVYLDRVKYTPRRRVILSTNVAETGLTLANLKYVIDSGLNREQEYNPVYGVRGLITKPATKSRIEQRKGRAGRKFRGVFYPLYPDYIYERLQKIQFPQILVEDTSSCMLDIVVEQLKIKHRANEKLEFNANELDMVDVPSPDSLSSSMEKLYSLGFVSTNAPKWCPDIHEHVLAEPAGLFSITKLGHCAHRLGSGLDMESSRAILAAYYWKASIIDVVTAVVYSRLDDLGLEMDRTSEAKVDWAEIYKRGLPILGGKGRLLIGDEFIDGIILFNAVRSVISGAGANKAMNDLVAWCDKIHIDYATVLMFVKSRDELLEHMMVEGFELFSTESNSLKNSNQETLTNNLTRIKYCLYDGYRNNILTYDANKYTTKLGLEVQVPLMLRPEMWVSTMPRYLLYKELKLTKNMHGNYDIAANFVAICDSFVNIDLEFLK